MMTWNKLQFLEWKLMSTYLNWMSSVSNKVLIGFLLHVHFYFMMITIKNILKERHFVFNLYFVKSDLYPYFKVALCLAIFKVSCSSIECTFYVFSFVNSFILQTFAACIMLHSFDHFLNEGVLWTNLIF